MDKEFRRILPVSILVLIENRTDETGGSYLVEMELLCIRMEPRSESAAENDALPVG